MPEFFEKETITAKANSVSSKVMGASPIRVLMITSPPPPQLLSPFSTFEKLMPLGVGFLIAVLERAGHKVDFVDMNLPNQSLPDISQYEFVGISANTVYFRGTRQIVNECIAARKRGWKGKIIIGGPHTVVSPESIPPEVDYVVQGEGEFAITDIVNGRETEKWVRAKRIKDLDSLPRPAFHHFFVLPYHCTTPLIPASKVFPLSSSRGCPFRCTFCSAKTIWGRHFSYFCPERVVDDICFLIKDFGVKGIYFREDNFTVNKDRVIGICEGILRARVPILWATETRVDTVDEEMLSLMYRAGCRGLYMGVEAASQRLLDEYGKDITIQQIENVFAWTRKIGIGVQASFLTDTPGERLEDRLAMFRMIKKWNPEIFGINHFTGLPGSELYDKVIKEKSYLFIDDVGLAHMPFKPYPRMDLGLIRRKCFMLLHHPRELLKRFPPFIRRGY